MSNIFIASSPSDRACAELLGRELTRRGYAVAQEGQSASLQGPVAARTPEQEIVASAALLFVWSAARSGLVEQWVLFALQLKKPVIAVTVDATLLPAGLDTLSSVQFACSAADATSAVARLLPLLPPPGTSDPFIQIVERLAHPHISERKDAIDAAAAMLARDEHRDELLALLAYIANKDLITSVRDSARAVLDAQQSRLTPATPARATLPRSPDIFPIVCGNGHTTYINARRLCSQKEKIIYRQSPNSNKREREFVVHCETKGCEEVMSVYIDCGGYA